MPDQVAEAADAKTDAVKHVANNPIILDKVDYVYTSYAQVSINNLDFRIAFGDRVPPEGDVKPVVGLIMAHQHAKALLKVLAENVPKIESLLERLRATEDNNPAATS